MRYSTPHIMLSLTLILWGASNGITAEYSGQYFYVQNAKQKPIDEQPASGNLQYVFSENRLEQILGAQLIALLNAVELGDPKAAETARIPNGYLVNGDGVRVKISASNGIDGMPISNWLASHGIEATWAFDAYHVEAVMPIRKLRDLAQEPNITFVELATLLKPTATSEGLRALRIDRWKNIGDLSGVGVKIMVIDQFNQRLFARQRANHEIPTEVQTTEVRLNSDETSDHGNKVLEVLYDVAPEASYIIASAYTEGELASLFDVARSNAVDVVSLSLAISLLHYNDGQPQTDNDLLANMLYAYNSGVLTVTASGNNAKKHWSGEYKPDDRNVRNHDWNFNIFNADRLSPTEGSSAINVLKVSDNDSCIPNGSDVGIESVFEEAAFARTSQNYYELRLMRQGADAQWYNYEVARGEQTKRVIHTRVYSEAPTFGTSESLVADEQSIGVSPGCRARSARYGIKLIKNPIVGLTDKNSAYIQLFSEGFDLQFSVVQSSIVGSAASPWTFSVGAAYCDSAFSSVRPIDSDCNHLGLASYSGQGPVARIGGRRPFIPPSGSFPTMSPYEWDASLPAIKPEVLALTNISTSLSGQGDSYRAFSGTSASVPYVAGMAALFIQRFGEDVRHNPKELKYALSKLAMFRDEELLARGYLTNATYDRGFGLIRFQKEARLQYRGCPISVEIFQPVTSSASGPAMCGDVFRDGYDETVRVRFLDEMARPVLYPLGYPMISFVGGPMGSMQSDLKGGESVWDILHNYPYLNSAQGVPLIGGKDGWFVFPQLKFVRIPPDRSGGIGIMTEPYFFRVQAQNMHDDPIATIGLSDTFISDSIVPIAFYVCQSNTLEPNPRCIN